MKSILKNSLLMLAVAAATVCSTATAQVLINDISEAPTAAAGGQVNAIIDMATGELIVQIGGGVQVFVLTVTDGLNFFDTAATLPGLSELDPANPFVPGSQPLESGLTQNDPDAIGMLTAAGVRIGVFNLGLALAPGLSIAELNDAGFNLRFDGQGRQNNPALPQPNDFDISAPDNIFVVAGSAVPEPSSLSLLALAGLGVVARRRLKLF